MLKQSVGNLELLFISLRQLSRYKQHCYKQDHQFNGNVTRTTFEKNLPDLDDGALLKCVFTLRSRLMAVK